MMHRLSALRSSLLGPALAALAATLLSTAATAATPAATPNATERELNELVDRYFEEILPLNPVFASQIGDYRFNDRFANSIGPEHLAASLALDRRYLQAVDRLDAAKLSPGARITYDVFKAGRERDIRGAGFPNELLPIDQFSNPATDFAVMGSGSGAHPFGKREDYETFLKRIDGFIVYLDQAITNMRAGIKAGVVQPRAVMVKVVPQLESLLVSDPEQSVFWEPLKNFPDSVTVAERTRLEGQYREAISKWLMPAYQRLLDFTRTEYLPAARDTVGWSALPRGPEWYAYFVAAYTTTDMKPEEIHQLGLKEVARIEGEMNAVREQVGFKGDLKAFFEYLKTDPKFYFKTPQELVDGYTALKTRIDALLPKMFNDFPKAPYEVRAVEPFRAQSSAGAFYESPSEDGKRPGIFYVNTYDLKAQPKFGMETLSLHEAAPGHHFQIAIQQELEDIPRFRRFDGYTAYAEGWALYAESIGKELGLFTDPYQYYGRLSDEMLRAMRLVVDTGLHAKGWSREQAIDYMLEHSSMAENDVIAEVERYIVIPGQALGYKIGQLRISAMRRKAEAQLGPRFDVKEFHSQVLRDGSLPMSVLEQKIDRWVASQQRAAN
ncbi:MAG: DUF885 domain-containing protein [Gammaproteobacteria bacterium]|nr:DUF885 domain-containing protein [Gammaproteobacteria bacterium]